MGIYVWIDVAIVYLLCAVPLAVALAGVISLTLSRITVVLVSAVALVIAVAVLMMPIRANMPLLLGLRATVALSLALAAVLAWSVLSGARRVSGPRHGILALGLITLLIVPCAYVGARAANDLARFDGLMSESRPKAAYDLTSSLIALNPSVEWNRIPVSKVRERLAETVEQLESAVASPLHRDGTSEARLNRARNLAMLERTDEALQMLSSLDLPEANNLRGEVLQVRGEWQAGFEAFRAARQGWEPRGESFERTTGLVQAVKGMAFCLRRLGQYSQAEATYQELLKIAPNADTHFLLAQFYEDAQDAKKSRFHAREAMALQPKQYRQAGEALIRKLSVFHFGCWGVYSAESRIK